MQFKRNMDVLGTTSETEQAYIETITEIKVDIETGDIVPHRAVKNPVKPRVLLQYTKNFL